MSSYKTHFIQSLKLAFPLVVGQVGLMIATLADNIMVGQLGHTYLAAVSLASAVFIIFMLFGTGFGISITTIVGTAYGREDKGAILTVFRSGFWMMAGLGGFLTASMMVVVSLLGYFGQDQNVVALAKPYAYLLAISIFPQMLFLHFKQFTEGLQNSVLGASVEFVGNGLNIILNYVLINGFLGFSKMDLVGAGIGSLVFRVVMVIACFVLYSVSSRYKHYLHELTVFRLNKKECYEIVKVGMPIGMQFSSEAAGFGIGTIMAGWCGSVAQAAHQIAFNIVSTTYLAASGISSAATIRISKYMGRRSVGDVYKAGNVAFIQVIVFMLVCGLLVWQFRTFIGGVLTQEPSVLMVAGELLVIAALFQIADGMQVVAIGTQRGMNDINFSALVSIIAYWGVSLPLGYFFSAFLGWGVHGIWYGYSGGLATAAVLLLVRYLMKVKYFFVSMTDID